MDAILVCHLDVSAESLGEMGMKSKLLLSILVAVSLVGMGSIASCAAANDSVEPAKVVEHVDAVPADSGPSTPVTGEKRLPADHPECFNTKKLNDPNDFCYQTIGEWNSTASTDGEVRGLVSIEQMKAIGATTAEIQRYYPEYTP